MKLWLIIVISLVVFLALALVVLIFVLWCKKRHWQKMKAAAEKCKRLHFDDKTHSTRAYYTASHQGHCEYDNYSLFPCAIPSLGE